MLKKSCLILVAVFILASFSPVNAESDWMKWEEAPPLSNFTIVFSISISEDIFAEIIVGEMKEGSNSIRSNRTHIQTEKKEEEIFFNAVYSSNKKPAKFIEKVWRGQQLSFIKDKAVDFEKLMAIIELIEEEEGWAVFN